MASVQKQRYTPAEYLVIERAAPTRHEYYQGEMFAMAGASREHNIVRNNGGGFLWQALLGKPCESYSSDMRVKVSRTGLYTYPDIVVACEPVEFEDGEHDTLLNPRVIVEVLSPSTEAYDRGGKFRQYEQIPTLLEYILMAQDEAVVERFVRQPGENWTRVVYEGLDAALDVSTLQISIPLAVLYDRVVART